MLSADVLKEVSLAEVSFLANSIAAILLARELGIVMCITHVFCVRRCLLENMLILLQIIQTLAVIRTFSEWTRATQITETSLDVVIASFMLLKVVFPLECLRTPMKLAKKA